MIRIHVVTFSAALALMVVAGVANAEPVLTRKGSEGGPSSQTRQTEPNWYRARAMQEGAPPAQIVREGTSRQTGCRYQYSGGPKGLPITC